jgi:hypothetical protein
MIANPIDASRFMAAASHLLEVEHARVENVPGYLKSVPDFVATGMSRRGR